MHLVDRVDDVTAAAQQAYLPPNVAASSQIRPSHYITEMECPSISNCNAEEGDERGTTEHNPKTPSESDATKKDTTEVSCVHFYHSN
jgi:hypothetical protein